MRNATLCFLVKENNNQIAEVCLAMKKRGFGVGRWNGSGGKVKHEINETIENALKREALEEIGVDIEDFIKTAELEFTFPHNKDWNQRVHVFLVKNWKGEPQESEEMSPNWFHVNQIPFDDMWSDDIYWLPKVLNNQLLKGKFVFDKDDKIVKKEIKIVEEL